MSFWVKSARHACRRLCLLCAASGPIELGELKQCDGLPGFWAAPYLQFVGLFPFGECRHGASACWILAADVQAYSQHTERNEEASAVGR